MTPYEQIKNLLGDKAFFVPCEWGTKCPLVTYVERPFASTQTEPYRAIFAAQPTNIAVYLGKASGGLCALDFDSDADLTAFMELNPALTQTTQSRGSRGGMVWIRISGDYPASCNPAHKHFEWRADERLSTIYGQHPKGMQYQVVVDLPPLTVAFADLVWPAGWELPWVASAAAKVLQELEQLYGKPFYTVKDRVTGLNERFWAGLYSRENMVLFDPDDRTFWRYEAARGVWAAITVDLIREAISTRILEISRESQQWTLEIQITQHRLNAVVGALKGIVERRGAFSRRKRFIHAGNGVIRFPSDTEIEFGGYSSEDYSRNQSPLNFDPAAECPRFLNELLLPAVSVEDADLLQRWAGLALFGYNLPQRFLILDGTPNGGKGTLVRILQALVGAENCYQLRTKFLDDRFEMFRFRTKTLLIGPDVAGDFLMESGASMLKVLVGGDPMSVEAKTSNGDFSMFGTFNIIMTCNSRLRVRIDGDTGAWRRRMLIVRYEKPPPKKRILDFDQVLLRDEGSGILRWALAGFVKLQQEFSEIGDFKLTESQLGRIDSLLDESESLRVFVQSGLEAASGCSLTNTELTQAYAEFCADKGWNALPVTVVEKQAPDLVLQTFHAVRSHSIEREGRKSNRGWRGVRLKDFIPAEPEPIQDKPDHPFAYE